MSFCSPMRLYRCQLYAKSLFRLTIAIFLCTLMAACSKHAEKATNPESIPQPILVPALTIGGEASVDGVLFGSISGLVAVNSTGRIYVGDRQASTIYVFNAQGKLVGEIGQKGEGPGEFARLSRIRIGPSDTLYAFDSRVDRISAFEPTGHSLAYGFKVSEDSMGSLPDQFVGVLDTGFIITWVENPSIEDGTGLTDLSVYARHVDWAGLPGQNSLVRLPGKSWLVAGTENGFTVSAIPFGPVPFIHLGPGG